jgi:hypothetical protein
MNEKFLQQVGVSKESIDWWQEQATQTAFEAEELNFRYEMGELTEEELLIETKKLDGKIGYLMAKGNFEHKTLFETFTKEITK